ncbi:hypothetical protein GYMLUDRAFT_39770 [Collybiopsis luxurians FD-317 M1]|nr:hypothetical protein GYMLUDRAFT_39770 [Collybiopsis luxurians FD-317 M1]
MTTSARTEHINWCEVQSDWGPGGGVKPCGSLNPEPAGRPIVFHLIHRSEVSDLKLSISLPKFSPRVISHCSIERVFRLGTASKVASIWGVRRVLKKVTEVRFVMRDNVSPRSSEKCIFELEERGTRGSVSDPEPCKMNDMSWTLVPERSSVRLRRVEKQPRRR